MFTLGIIPVLTFVSSRLQEPGRGHKGSKGVVGPSVDGRIEGTDGEGLRSEGTRKGLYVWTCEGKFVRDGGS